MTNNETTCRICGSLKQKKIGQENRAGQSFTILKCKNCSLIFIQEIYSPVSPEYSKLQDLDMGRDFIWQQTEHKRTAHKLCLNIFKRYFPTEPENKKPTLLDVGCGIGGFLRCVHVSFNCYGFDASPRQAHYANKYFPHVRYATSLAEYKKQCNFPFPAFDFITLWDVLEHIRNPKEFLDELAGALSPRGLIFIAVPGAEAMQIKSSLISKGWPKARFSWNPQEHVNYFTPKTMSLLLAKCHLRVVRTGTIPVYPRSLSVFEAIRRLGFAVLRAFPNLAPQFFVLAEKRLR